MTATRRAKLLSGFLIVAVASAAPFAAEASCVPPVFDVIWSYPADGQSDVPTNAQVVMLTTLGSWSSKATLNGVDLAEGADRYRFTTPTLAANTTHTLVVSPRGEMSGAVKTLTFRTGSGPMASHPPEPESSQQVETGKRTLDAVCARALAAGDCYDTGQDEYLTFHTAHAPVAWVVDFLNDRGASTWTNLWPGACGSPEVLVHSNDDRCYTLTAVNEIGELAAPVRYCHAPPLISVPGNGCGVSGGTWPGLGIALAALGVLRRLARGR